jgi:hypothetical protein
MFNRKAQGYSRVAHGSSMSMYKYSMGAYGFRRGPSRSNMAMGERKGTHESRMHMVLVKGCKGLQESTKLLMENKYWT